MDSGHLVLVVENETHIADVVCFLLRERGFRVSHAEDGLRAWDLARAEHPDLVLLDLGLPGLDGLELFRRLRTLRPNLPVIMLTARAEEVDRVLGLELGADDYITKPFSNPELVARVKAVLRRCHPDRQDNLLRSGELVMAPETFHLTWRGRAVQLPRHEFLLLLTLLKHPGHVFTREQLLRHMYGLEAGVTDRAVDAAVRRVRTKLGDGAPVESVYGLGYRLGSCT